jgi:hypothetical protein
MAAPVVTPAAVQAALGSNPMNARILRSDQTDTSTVGRYYCIGGVDAPGRARWCPVTNTDNAATQAAAILTALRA